MSSTASTSWQGGQISRRGLLLSLPAIAAARKVLAQGAGAPQIRVRALNHFTLAVSDPKRSLEFYQRLFGTPIQAHQGQTPILRIGTGPQFLALSAAGTAAPSISHLCLTVDGFDVDRLIQVLAAHGVTKAEAAGGGLSGGPMKVRVRMRGPESGGAPGGTPELYFADPDGIVVQLQDPRYCGGGGALGNACAAIEPAPAKGLIAVKDLSHFTISVSDAQRSNKFYQDLFGFGIRSFQGPSAPTLAVGPGVAFLMFAGGGGAARAGAPPAPPRPASINHVCLSMERFDVAQVQKALENVGIKPREGQSGPVGPLRHYVSMRMENRGGAKEGTPELYFTDPDGLLIQLQDVSYCGGGGYLGNECQRTQ
jgi:catechol 2,3-dioxygenase-like lactoylglutathione lyase family enzyme